MTAWTHGYVADVGYTFGYYKELNPQWIKLAFLNAGIAFPEVGVACELGFGQGLSANLHAAASVVQWHGTDFNPTQAGFAQELAAASGADVKLHDHAFAEFCSLADLPNFDFIALHGIWSWISDENRAVIVDFIRRKLKVGGVLYLSYNALPGWSALGPMRHLLSEHAHALGTAGHGIVSRIDGALEFTEKLLATNPIYLRANPQIAERFKKIKTLRREYLAHEYFNRDWHPMHFATVAEWLEPAKVSYACSAHYIDHVDVVNLTEAQQVLLDEIPDPMFRESVRDFMVDQQFRRDYWVKGPRQLTALEQAEGWRKQRVVLIKHRAEVALKVTGALGEAILDSLVYNPLLDLLADYQPRTLAQIEFALKDTDISFAQLCQAVLVMMGMDCLTVVQDEAVAEKARKSTEKINQRLFEMARSRFDTGFLACPLTGSGIAVERFQQLFLLSRKSGKQTPREWAEDTWAVLAAQGQAIVKDGKPLETAQSNLFEINQQAEVFAEKRLPILIALGIA